MAPTAAHEESSSPLSHLSFLRKRNMETKHKHVPHVYTWEVYRVFQNVLSRRELDSLLLIVANFPHGSDIL